jgi:hypothetical protein
LVCLAGLLRVAFDVHGYQKYGTQTVEVKPSSTLPALRQCMVKFMRECSPDLKFSYLQVFRTAKDEHQIDGAPTVASLLRGPGRRFLVKLFTAGEWLPTRRRQRGALTVGDRRRSVGHQSCRPFGCRLGDVPVVFECVDVVVLCPAVALWVPWLVPLL